MTRRQAFTARGAERPRLRHVSTPGRSAALVVVGLLLASLLTAPALASTARSQPYGPVRTVLVEVTDVLAWASSATRLDVPWRTLAGLVHGPPTAPVAPAPVDTSPPVLVAPAPPATEEPTAPATPAPSPTPEPTGTATPDPSPTPTTEPTSPVAPAPPPPATARVPTAVDPLRVWVAGDSMWERPGPRLVAALEATGAVDVVELEYRYSTGLTRPDFFDWPAHARSQLATLRPELVLFVVGPNDSQPLVDDGVHHEPRTAGFDAAYTTRVRTMMEVLAEGSDHVMWIGLPIMRDAGFDQRMVDLDRIHAGQAAAFDGVQHVPTRALFSDADGAYAAYLPGPDGAMRPMRNRDGIHLSDDGAARLVHHLFAILDARYELAD